MGTFTPIANAPAAQAQDEQLERERADYASDMREEEMEQHISATMQAAEDDQTSGGGANRIEAAADRLAQSAQALEQAAHSMRMFGELRVSGTENVAGVMGDAVRSLTEQRAESGTPLTAGLDNFTAAGAMAQVMGITPASDGSAPIRENLARFGMFLDQAMRMGLSPDQTEGVVREVKASPDRSLTPETREALVGFAADRARTAPCGRRTRSQSPGVGSAWCSGADCRLRHTRRSCILAPSRGQARNSY